MAYSVPPLPYAYDALEPSIDKATMEVHHDKHHQAYVDKVNAALEGTPLADAAIEDVLRDLSAVPEGKRAAVRNNGGGHYNHTLFWESMSPDGGGEPSGELAQAIDSAFGSFADFQAKLKEAGVNQFGSGWSWLVHDGSGLAVVGTPNQDTPLSDGKTPLLGVDVWEHAYYLKYQNRRPDYIDAWWNVVDWSRSPSASPPPPSARRLTRRPQARRTRPPAQPGAGRAGSGRFGLLRASESRGASRIAASRRPAAPARATSSDSRHPRSRSRVATAAASRRRADGREGSSCSSGSLDRREELQMQPPAGRGDVRSKFANRPPGSSDANTSA